MRLFHALLLAVQLCRLAQAKAVFAHYMVGNITDEHAHQDVDDAIAMGLDAFSLNIGYPQASHVYPALASLFGYTAYLNSLGTNFKLFISMDLWAAGAIKHADGTSVNAFDYGDLFAEFKDNAAYYRGPNGHPFVTTFSDGGMNNDSLLGFRKQVFQDNVYFVPDLDHTEGFNTSHPYWWDYWGPTFEGVTAWEMAWMSRDGYGGLYVGDVDLDTQVIEGSELGPGTKAHGKSYMMPLSTLQYKDAYATNVYRPGGLNLIKRMENILKMPTQPDFVQLITWNDGPESHYIGNLWPEQNTDAEPNVYMRPGKASHTAWQPLISSWIAAYKNGVTSRDQFALPPGTVDLQNAVGAIWYKTILQSVDCNGASPPSGFSSGTDTVAWAVVVDGVGSYRIRYGSQSADLAVGLNSGEWPATAGSVRFEIVDSLGTLMYVANSGACISDFCVDGIYNMNVQVAGFSSPSMEDTECAVQL
ncbi:glucan endo-alpha-glucosidase agn1 [Phlyctema vagabunda]|uniref:Glucan endo-alpha-glucosidase agn1 n=1 Tax=Phlyctema vagabunda TaxID=108571 RepID=A0ABR4P8M6_9HELO